MVAKKARDIKKGLNKVVSSEGGENTIYANKQEVLTAIKILNPDWNEIPAELKQDQDVLRALLDYVTKEHTNVHIKFANNFEFAQNAVQYNGKCLWWFLLQVKNHRPIVLDAIR